MKRAFTLIELLIVVAIIAILAAIAVPNFLEAQVRSKISRVKSDLRTLATAIESYMIDNNNVIGSNDAKIPDPYGFEAAYSRLTTPVAYMSSILKIR
jgi:prepilin-type N-terminal cleavage/methylation domain-containing protein